MPAPALRESESVYTPQHFDEQEFYVVYIATYFIAPLLHT